MNSPMTPENGFSFRMFDLYRRFVEILQSNEKFLKAFKAGVPSEEICQAIIARTFIHRQPIDKITNLVHYLRKNAPILVAHAENTPKVWNTAVLYTNWCISEIKRYLKNKNINFKSDFESMPDIAKEIGKYIYKNGGNSEQIKIIEEYLKEDLRNPKRSIPFSKKNKKCKHKEKVLSALAEEDSQVVVIENEESDSIVSVDMHDESNEGLQFINGTNTCQEYSAPQTFFREDLMRTEFTAEIEDLLQPQGHPTTNDLLHIESPERSEEFVLQNKDMNELEKTDKTDTCDAEDIKSILESSKCESEDNDFEYVEEVSETDMSGEGDQAEYSQNTSTPNSYPTNVNKRKILSDGGTNNCAKKLFISKNLLNRDSTHKDNTYESFEYVTLSGDDNLKDSTCNSVQTPKTTDHEIIQIDEIHYSISETNNNSETNKKQDTNNNQTEVPDKLLDENEIKSDPEMKEESGKCNCGKQSKENVTSYIQESVKYSDVMDMTYEEALKMFETLLAFCELKDAVSLKEYLVLRIARDKMQLRIEEDKRVNKN